MEHHIDITALLAPIPGGSPSGTDMKRLPDYVKMEEAARSDDSPHLGDWEPKNAKSFEPKKLIDLCSEVIAAKSKDLRAMSRLGQALAVQHGFTGARDALELASGLLENFWDTLHPELDEGEAIYRRAPLEQMFNRMSQALEFHPLTGSGKPAYGHAHHTEARAVDQLRKLPTRVDKNTGNEVSGERLYQVALEEGKVSGEMFDNAINATPGEQILAIATAVAECQTQLERLEAACSTRMSDDDQPDAGQLRKTLAGCASLLSEVVQRRGLAVPAPTEASAATGIAEAATTIPALTGVSAPAVGGTVLRLAIPPGTAREQALGTLEQIRDYFRSTEPHSPVSFMIDRAVTWARLPLDKMLQELVDDDDSRRRIERLIGIKRQD